MKGVAFGTGETIHPQLMLLLELQDLRAQRRELEQDKGGSAEVESRVFNIDPDEALERLAEAIEHIESGLEPKVRARYDRIRPNRDRVVVPVLHGVCYGCFVSIPTATAGDQEVHQLIQTCENCGSFIYVVS
jgi:predicted  nucleic acid-binding Zn-ribbon protein